MGKRASWEASSHSASRQNSAFYETRSFITVFTRWPQWSLSWPTRIRSASSHAFFRHIY